MSSAQLAQNARKNFTNIFSCVCVLCVHVDFPPKHLFNLSFAFFHMVVCAVAQLLTIEWNEYNGGAHSAELVEILESIKQLREEYEYRAHEYSMSESNSIGLSIKSNIKH